MKLHAAVRADLREVPGGQFGRRVVLKTVKNQLAVVGQAEFEFLEGEGISAELELLELGLRHGVLNRVAGGVCMPPVCSAASSCWWWPRSKCDARLPDGRCAGT